MCAAPGELAHGWYLWPEPGPRRAPLPGGQWGLSVRFWGPRTSSGRTGGHWEGPRTPIHTLTRCVHSRAHMLPQKHALSSPPLQTQTHIRHPPRTTHMHPHGHNPLHTHPAPLEGEPCVQRGPRACRRSRIGPLTPPPSAAHGVLVITAVDGPHIQLGHRLSCPHSCCPFPSPGQAVSLLQPLSPLSTGTNTCAHTHAHARTPAVHKEHGGPRARASAS